MVNLIAIIVLYCIFGMNTGCAMSVIVKECKQVEGDPKYVCKTTKPWE